MSLVFRFNLGDHKRGPSRQYSREEGIFLQGQNGRAVVLIHGLTGTPNEMRFLASSLNKQGYSVICPRLANHGEPLSVLKDTPWQDFYESAKNAFLEIGKGNEMVFVAGLSMGALFSLLLAVEFPKEVKGVSCLSPTLFYDGWNMPKYQWLLPLAYSTFLKNFFYFKEEPPYGIKNEAVRRYVHNYYSQAKLDQMDKVAEYGYPFFPLSLLDQLHRVIEYTCAKLGEVCVPVQVIQAQEDDMTSVKNSQFIYDRVASEKKEFVLLHNSYHVITADQERDKVAQKMDAFFAAIRDGKREGEVAHAG
jgi:carboxylesterase